ncbi:hypothetical protein [uncultured Parasphingopyxis sp.]|uniref:hypothetical protein n=1 Tax=uncultured Parasphingopyxis sp. TaxID=1547918 RepID=UPI0026040E39|nr:hypothetical protein [uncultured Parasphingopyxis sp.]
MFGVGRGGYQPGMEWERRMLAMAAPPMVSPQPPMDAARALAMARANQAPQEQAMGQAGSTDQRKETDGNGLSAREVIGLVLAGLGQARGNNGPSPLQMLGLYRQRREAEQAANRRTNMLGQAEKMGMSQEQRFALENDPDSFFENFSQRFRPTEVDAGDSYILDGGPQRGGTSYMAPETFTDGPNQMLFDRQNGGAQMVHEGQTDAEWYAQAQGFLPGTPEFNQAVQDHQLPSWGPTATGNRSAIQGQRDAAAMERTSATIAGANNRNAATIAGANQRNRATNQSQERRTRNGGSGGRRTGGQPREGQTARNPTTGQRIRFTGGRWVPIN